MEETNDELRFFGVHDQFSFLEMLEETGLAYAQGKKGCWFQGISVLPNYRIE